MSLRSVLHPCLALLALVAFTAVPVGCDQSSTDHTDHDHAGHDHADHDHDHGDDAAMTDDHGHGPTVELGSVEFGGFTVTASRDGDVKAGGELPVDVHIEGDGPVDAVRAWVGTETAAGSIKGRLDPEGDGWHAHVMVPAVMPEDARLWIEIQSGDERAAGSVPLDG